MSTPQAGAIGINNCSSMNPSNVFEPFRVQGIKMIESNNESRKQALRQAGRRDRASDEHHSLNSISLSKEHIR